MKVAICEYCGKPGDYPVCRPPSKPSKAELLSASEKRVKELEAALEEFLNWYPDAGQLINAFKADEGVAWSEWDEQVRTRLIALGSKARIAVGAS